MSEDQAAYGDDRGVWCPKCMKFHRMDEKQKMRADAIGAIANAIGSALQKHDAAADDLHDQVALVCAGATMGLASLLSDLDDPTEAVALIGEKFKRGLDSAIKIVRAIDQARGPGPVGTAGSA